MGLDGGKKAIRAHIDKRISALHKVFHDSPDRLFLVGGSWRAIARIDMERTGYPLKVLHEYRMTPDAVADTIEYINKADIAELREQTGTSEARMRLVPLAAEVLGQLIKRSSRARLRSRPYGIREGLLYEQMTKELKARDPLIEAAYHAEAMAARSPGFGRKLFDFIKPLFPDATRAEARVIKAACLLHDVSWRAHPDYRADAVL